MFFSCSHPQLMTPSSWRSGIALLRPGAMAFFSTHNISLRLLANLPREETKGFAYMPSINVHVKRGRTEEALRDLRWMFRARLDLPGIFLV